MCERLWVLAHRRTTIPAKEKYSIVPRSSSKLWQFALIFENIRTCISSGLLSTKSSSNSSRCCCTTIPLLSRITNSTVSECTIATWLSLLSFLFVLCKKISSICRWILHWNIIVNEILTHTWQTENFLISKIGSDIILRYKQNQAVLYVLTWLLGNSPSRLRRSLKKYLIFFLVYQRSGIIITFSDFYNQFNLVFSTYFSKISDTIIRYFVIDYTQQTSFWPQSCFCSQTMFS